MQILVWGESPAAGWLTGRLHQLKHEVQWLTSDAVVDTLQRFGQLELRSPLHQTTVSGFNVGASIDTLLKPPLNWIILAMPVWAIGEAVREMARRIPPEHCPPIFILANGIGAIEKVQDFFPDTPVIQGFPTRYFAWPLLPDGTTAAYEVVVSDGRGGVAITAHDRVEEIAHLLRTIAIGPVEIHERTAVQWSDVLWQIQANAVSTLLQIAPQDVYTDPMIFNIEHLQLTEAIQVIDHQKIQLVSLPGVDVQRLAWQIRVLPPSLLRGRLAHNDPIPGLYADLVMNRRRSDAAYLNGAIARKAYELRIHTPVNHTLAVSVTDVAEGRALWKQFDLQYLQTLIRIAKRV